MPSSGATLLTGAQHNEVDLSVSHRVGAQQPTSRDLSTSEKAGGINDTFQETEPGGAADPLINDLEASAGISSSAHNSSR